MKNILVLVSLFMMLMSSQQAKASVTLESMADIEGVEYIYISESMLKGMAGNSMMNELNLGEITGDLKSLEVVSADMCEKEGDLKKIRQKVTSLAKDMELMSKMKEDGETVSVYIVKSGVLITRLLLVVDEWDSITIIYLQGKIDDTAIKNLTYY